MCDGSLSCSRFTASIREWWGESGERGGRQRTVPQDFQRCSDGATGGSLCLRAGAVAELGLLCLPSSLVPLRKLLGTADTFPCSSARSPEGDKTRSELGPVGQHENRVKNPQRSREKGSHNHKRLRGCWLRFRSISWGCCFIQPSLLGCWAGSSDPGEPRPGGRWDRAEPLGLVEGPASRFEPPVGVTVRESQPQLTVPGCLGSAQSTGTLEFIIC